MTRGTTESIVMANGGGFGGDHPTAARRQVAGGMIDWLVIDYLAEATMAILLKRRRCTRRPGTRWTSSRRWATCSFLARSRASRSSPTPAAVVSGDDLYEALDAIGASDETLPNMEDRRGLSEVRAEVYSANVYLGTGPIVRALEAAQTSSSQAAAPTPR